MLKIKGLTRIESKNTDEIHKNGAQPSKHRSDK